MVVQFPSPVASLYQNEPLNFTPGAKFSYTNSGYVILGLIIEKLSGEQYDDYIKSHIFDVAKIVNTGNFDRDHPVADAAQGYTLSDIKPNSWRINTLLGSVKGGPAGGGFTTVDDLNAFVKALETPPLDIAEYGLILASGYGEIEADVKEHMLTRYCYKVKA